MKKLPASPLSPRLHRFVLPALALATLMPSAAHAATLYWDTNDSVAGAGVAADGAWSTSLWSTSSTGEAATSAYVAGSDVVFSAGSDSTTATITLSAGVSVNSLLFEEGAVSISGSQAIAVGSGGITVANTSGAVSIGNVGAGTRITASTAQTWTNNSANKLIVGDGTLNGLVTILGSGRVQLGNDTTSNGFDGSDRRIQIGAYDSLTETYTSGNAGFALANGGLANTTVYLVSGSLSGPSNNRMKGLTTATLVLQGDFTINTGTDGSAQAVAALTLDGDHVLTMGSSAISGFPLYVAKIDEVGAGTALTLAGTGNIAITGTASTYGGGTVLRDTVTLRIASDGSLGTVPTVAATNVTFEGNAILQAGAATVSLDATRNLLISDGVTATLDSNGNTFTVNGVVAGSGSLTKAGTGTVELKGLNTYSGITRVTGGTLSVDQLSNGGSASGIGQASGDAANLLLSNGTTLKYAGATTTSDRLFTINGTANTHGATLDASGTGAIHFSNTGNVAYGTTNQTRTLTLSGVNTGNNILAAKIANNGTGVVTLTKSGTGTWLLSNDNTYTGVTTVNGGKLFINGIKSGGGAVAVNATGTFGGSGTIAGATTVAQDAFLSAGANSGVIGNLVFTGTLNISGLAAGNGGLLFDLGAVGAVGASDKITSGALTIGSGLLEISDFSFTTTENFGAGTYTLLSATSIVGTLGSTLSGSVGGLDGVLSISGNDIILTVSAIPEPSSFALFGGLASLALIGLRRRRA